MRFEETQRVASCSKRMINFFKARALPGGQLEDLSFYVDGQKECSGLQQGRKNRKNLMTENLMENVDFLKKY